MQSHSQMHGSSFAGTEQNGFVKHIDTQLYHCLLRTAGIAVEVMGPLGMLLEKLKDVLNTKSYFQNDQFSVS